MDIFYAVYGKEGYAVVRIEGENPYTSEYEIFELFEDAAHYAIQCYLSIHRNLKLNIVPISEMKLNQIIYTEDIIVRDDDGNAVLLDK